MNAIEAVARALANYAGDDYDFEHGQKELYMDMARAALTALRDNGVTAKMFLAWNDAHGPADEFRAMLDAALQGDSGSNGRPG